jgi:tetratricopeptide (TPR) repeat protein
MNYCQALELDPRSESARISMAYLLQSEGRFMYAWNTLTEGSARDHADLSPDLLAARGIVSLQMEQLQGAMSDLSRSIFLFPSPETLTNRGVVHCFLGDRPNAMRDYQRALTIDPKYPLAHFNIGNMLFSEHRFRDAIRSYSKALEGGSHGDVVLVNRALAREMVGEREGAMADLSGAISLNPHAAHAFFNRGNLYRCRGDLQAAQQDYQSALRLLPGDWLCGYYLGQVTGELGDRDRATAIFQQAAISELPLPSFSSSS